MGTKQLTRTDNGDGTISVAFEFNDYDQPKADETLTSAAKWFQSRDTYGQGLREPIADDLGVVRQVLRDPDDLTNAELRSILMEVVFRFMAQHGRAYRKVVGEALAQPDIETETDKVLADDA